jgi:urease accessory protein
MPDDSTWSELAVAQVRQQSLKIINPKAPSTSCHAVLASYGGGLVAGDSIRLRVRCEEGSRLLLTTQANTRIFKSIDGSQAEQLTEGFVAEKALAVVLPDPLVPQADSRYNQAQHWHLAADAVLLLADWWHAGRTDVGEKFAFTTFATRVAGKRGRPLSVARPLCAAPRRALSYVAGYVWAL